MKCVNCNYESKKVKLTLSVDKNLVEWAKNNLNISNELEILIKETMEAEKEFKKATRKGQK